MTVEEACKVVAKMGYKYLSKVSVTPSVILVVPLGNAGEELDGDWYAFNRQTGEEIPYGLDDMIVNESVEQIYDPPEQYKYKRKIRRLWHK